MKVILHIDEPNDAILAYRALEYAIESGKDIFGTRFDNGQVFFVIKNKKSYTVRLQRGNDTMIGTDK